MNQSTDDNHVEDRKKAIFNSMGPRRQKQILKRGYDKWDPFELPNDPIDLRRDKTRRTTQMLVREFMQGCSHETYSNTFGQGVLEIALGIINNDERCRGMYEFSCWYRDLLEREKEKQSELQNDETQFQ